MTAKRTITILNVDDDDAGRYATSRVLGQVGFEVIEAANGAETLRLVKENPDLVVLDVNLPDMSGFEVCQRLKADPATSMIPVLHLSATYLDDQSRVIGLESGAEGYLTQPVEPPVLIAYVKALLRTRQAQEALRESEQRCRQIFEGIGDAVMVYGSQGKFLDYNKVTLRRYGYSREEFLRLEPADIVHPGFLQAMRDSQKRIWAGETTVVESAHHCKDGRVIPVEAHARTIEYQGEPAILAVVRDITERKRAEREIEERRLYLEGVLGAAPDAIVTMDARHRIVEWNTGAEKLFGYSREEAIGQDLDHLVTSPDVYDEAVGNTKIVMSGKELPTTETVRYRKDGSPVDVIVAESPILVGGELIGAVAVYTDITARVQIEEALRALLLLDELTSLYNRRGFITMGQQQLKIANRMKRRMVLLFADLDHLKQINDTLGHPEGDRALIETAHVLKETFRESDIIARIGGDEFVVLAIETDETSGETLTTRLQENLEARNAEVLRRYKLSLSVGMARYNPERPCSVDELLARADKSMYEQKRRDLES